uniref:RING-type E3 ubiquitin transferase n=1 Tax=Aquila chrysaetos chrysaetos TaxID=223781 RepID=A0A663ESU3_AQUCH
MVSVASRGCSTSERSPPPSPPALPSPPQRGLSMATDREERCPICLDTWDDAACAMPCLHRFCFSCIRRWTDIKPECPLCKRRVTSIRHSRRGGRI